MPAQNQEVRQFFRQSVLSTFSLNEKRSRGVYLKRQHRAILAERRERAVGHAVTRPPVEPVDRDHHERAEQGEADGPGPEDRPGVIGQRIHEVGHDREARAHAEEPVQLDAIVVASRALPRRVLGLPRRGEIAQTLDEPEIEAEELH